MDVNTEEKDADERREQQAHDQVHDQVGHKQGQEADRTGTLPTTPTWAGVGKLLQEVRDHLGCEAGAGGAQTPPWVGGGETVPAMPATAPSGPASSS